MFGKSGPANRQAIGFFFFSVPLGDDIVVCGSDSFRGLPSLPRGQKYWGLPATVTLDSLNLDYPPVVFN